MSLPRLLPQGSAAAGAAPGGPAAPGLGARQGLAPPHPAARCGVAGTRRRSNCGDQAQRRPPTPKIPAREGHRARGPKGRPQASRRLLGRTGGPPGRARGAARGERRHAGTAPPGRGVCAGSCPTLTRRGVPAPPSSLRRGGAAAPQPLAGAPGARQPPRPAAPPATARGPASAPPERRPPPPRPPPPAPLRRHPCPRTSLGHPPRRSPLTLRRRTELAGGPPHRPQLSKILSAARTCAEARREGNDGGSRGRGWGGGCRTYKDRPCYILTETAPPYFPPPRRGWKGDRGKTALFDFRHFYG